MNIVIGESFPESLHAFSHQISLSIMLIRSASYATQYATLYIEVGSSRECTWPYFYLVLQWVALVWVEKPYS